ncbi:proline racemase family protein [Vagococcus vulneris]|uniref:Proline racemase n=1 Tax=Vagococcus vulneris TaxID=1977869 RepID=A0A429ZXK1_9ENTE|nr:proline racemase family protein [Vagococcus vulneris]RST98598.1 proline racemase [Vagococcus vulneris]
MKASKVMVAIDTHTAGEAARLVIGGVTKFPGKTMAEKKELLATKRDYLRTEIMHEPRGHNEMFGAFICEPVHDEADYGIIFMDAGGYLNMCGHNTIAAMTAAVETGWVDVEPGQREVAVKQDTPAGLVNGVVKLREDFCVESVAFENVESFLYKEGVKIQVPDFGEVTVDISFGGSFFALVPAADLGIAIEPENATKLSEIGIKIRDAVNEQIEIQHPTLEHIKTVDLVEIYGPAKNPKATYQNVVIFGDGQVDRSPCGTGTSAKLATLYAKGQMNVGDTFVYESILGTMFGGEIVKETEVGGYKAIIPRISGSAYINGFNTFLIDPTDPLKDGFVLG